MLLYKEERGRERDVCRPLALISWCLSDIGTQVTHFSGRGLFLSGSELCSHKSIPKTRAGRPVGEEWSVAMGNRFLVEKLPHPCTGTVSGGARFSNSDVHTSYLRILRNCELWISRSRWAQDHVSKQLLGTVDAAGLWTMFWVARPEWTLEEEAVDLSLAPCVALDKSLTLWDLLFLQQ